MNREQHSSQNEIAKFLEIAWRRKWVILLPFVLIGILVSLYGLYMPNIYRSSMSIFIESQRIPANYVRSTVTTDIENRMRTVRQQLTSRTKLLKVIKDLNLYPEAQRSGAPDEVLVARMRKNITVEIPGRSDDNFFRIHFNHLDPTMAMLGVSSLVSLFIEENLQIREQQAEGTTQFITDELENLKNVLEKQEAAIQSFKARHIGELPDQLETNLRMLDNLSLQLSENLESQREIENRILLLQQEIARLERDTRLTTSMEDGPEVVSGTLTELIAMRDTLHHEITRMESTFTQQHPDLINAQRRLAQLEDRILAVRNELSSQPVDRPTGIVNSPNEYTRELNNNRRQLNEDIPRQAALREEEKQLREKVALYQQRVETTPIREQELLSLSRNYENTKENYEDMLNKKQEAQLSENLEKRQQGERFRILDPANLPEQPNLPNRERIITMGFAGGLGIGLMLALLLELLKPGFYNIWQLQDHTDAPIVIGIPWMVSHKDLRKRRIRWLLGVGTGAALVVGGFILVDRMVLDLTFVVNRIVENLRSLHL